MTAARPLALAAVLAAGLAACGAPPEFATDGTPVSPAGSVAPDSLTASVQLHVAGEESSLPVHVLGSGDPLRLAFDRLIDDTGRPLEVTFVHTDRDGREDLLPTEYLTGFDRDDITDYQRSGFTGVPYVHYEYTFPNPRIGFRVSGLYRLEVRDAGQLLFARPFLVVEPLAEVEMGFGTTLAGGGAGVTTQPAARLTPGPRLSGFDAFQYTVCFARDGRLEAARCAPEPTAIDQAFFQYYLRREAAFEPSEPLFQLDLGLLTTNVQVVELDPAAQPPTAVLDLDYADFGGEVLDAVLATAPVIDDAYLDVGRARTDAKYVDVRFRYVPPGSRQVARPVYVLGGFNGWQPSPAARMEWIAAEGRYERTIRLKQGRYVYGYVSPGGPSRAGVSIGQPTLFTAMVFLRDPARFTDRLVAVESVVSS